MLIMWLIDEFSFYNGRMWSFGNGTFKKCASTIFCYIHSILLFRVEAVRRTPHISPVVRYYAMVDPCTPSITNR